MTFDVLRRAVDEWHTVKAADTTQANSKQRVAPNAIGKLIHVREPGVDGNRFTPAPTEVGWGCGKPG